MVYAAEIARANAGRWHHGLLKGAAQSHHREQMHAGIDVCRALQALNNWYSHTFQDLGSVRSTTTPMEPVTATQHPEHSATA